MGIKKGEKTFDYINICILAVFAVTIIIPFVAVVNNSIRSLDDIKSNMFTIIPERIDFSAYKFLLSDSDVIFNAYRASIFITLIGTVLSLLFTSMMAYSFSRNELKGKSALLLFVVITMFFSGGLIPSYLLTTGIGLRDSWWALILPSLISPWYMLILRNFFAEIPKALIEAARIEGANEADILYKIVLPLSTASIAAIGLFYAVGYWNSWFAASIYLETKTKFPLQLLLRIIMQQLDLENMLKRGVQMDIVKVYSENVKAAAIVITMLPILCVYPFLQKYFVKGVFMGSIKE